MEATVRMKGSRIYYPKMCSFDILIILDGYF